MKYKDLIVLSKKDVEASLAPIRTKEMCKRAELELCKLDGSIASLEQRIQDISSQYPIDFDRLITAIDDLDLNTRRKEQFQRIIDEMFGEDKPSVLN
jgi:hypothetical protein